MSWAVFWCCEPNARPLYWWCSCRLQCQATLTPEGWLGKKPKLPPSSTSADKTPQTVDGWHPSGAKRKAEAAPVWGLHLLMVLLPVPRALAHCSGAVNEMNGPGLRSRSPVSHSKLVCSFSQRVFFWCFCSLNICSCILPWLIAIKIQWIVRETCGFKNGFVRGCMRKLKHDSVQGCSGSQGEAASMGNEDTEYVQFTFHHIFLEDMYFMSRKWSCYYKMKIQMPQGLLEVCARRSRAVVKQ